MGTRRNAGSIIRLWGGVVLSEVFGSVGFLALALAQTPGPAPSKAQNTILWVIQGATRQGEPDWIGPTAQLAVATFAELGVPTEQTRVSRSPSSEQMQKDFEHVRELSKVGGKQIVFVVVGHGGPDGKVFLNAPDAPEPSFLEPSELAKIQRTLASNNSIVTLSAACYSGQMGAALQTTSDLTMTAAGGDSKSNFAPMVRQGLTHVHYEAFFYHFFTALRGQTPDRRSRVRADADGDGVVNYVEAYSYAFAKPLVGVPGKKNRLLDLWTGDDDKGSNPQLLFKPLPSDQPNLDGQTLAPCPDRQLQNHFDEYERLISRLERDGLFEAADRMRTFLNQKRKSQK